MFRIIFVWLFILASLADLVLVGLKYFDVIDWSWLLIIAIPFAVAIGGTIAFALFYTLIKIFVWFTISSIKD